jgi:formate-dependent nitrite reductase membrane component NrfD
MPHAIDVTRTIEWGWLIVIYLFLGGLSAGALALSGLANFLGRQERYVALARAGALVAPVPVMLGSALLVFDLGRPFFFWKLFVAFSPESPMWVGTWLLVAFSAVSAAYAYLFLPDRFKPWTPARPQAWKNVLAAAGLPIAVGVGIYTGVLLGAVPARPFWNTPMVAQLFLFSALSSGAALVMLVAPRLGGKALPEDTRLVLSVDVLFILLELFIVIPFILHGELSTLAARTSLGLILGGPLTGTFWVGVVLLGLVVPLTVETAAIGMGVARQRPVHVPRMLETAVAVLVLLGGFLLRYVFVRAGQLSEFI